MNTSRVLLCVCRPHVLPFIRSVSHNLKTLTTKMPKEVKHTAFLQKHRQKLKEKNQKYTPGTVNLKVLGSGAKGAARSLYIFSDQSRYMFNCGEGTQRQAHEHKMKLSKLEHIFITHNSWNNIGGLPGVALTIQDVGVPEITIHGPSGTVEIFNATSRFVILRDLNVKMADCSPGKYFEDNVMKVIYVPIVSTSQKYKAKIDEVSGAVRDNFLKEQMEDDIDYYAHERKKKIGVSPEKVQQKRQKTESTNEETPKQSLEAAMCYVCRLHPRPGALCLDKCVEKGVPPGPLLGKLKGGEDVVLADGTVVLSSDVRMPEDPGPVFIVVECPTVDYIDDLVNNSLFAQHQETALNDNDVASLVVHFTPQEVMNDLRYTNWMKTFSMSTQHLILNEENECMGSVAVHRVQYKLNLLHSGIFPLLGDKSIRIDQKYALDDGSVGTQIEQSSEIQKAPTENGICSYRGRTFDCVHLRPRKLWERKEELFLTPKVFIDEVNDEGFSDTLCQLRKDIELVSSNIVHKDSDPWITFLGTGSCIPNKTRNTSGILLHTSETDSILLDCGEGTYGQIVRFFGPEKSDAVLLGIKAIYVSHLHADHHIGLIGILKARRRAIERTTLPQSNEPIFLLAPQQILSWLSLYHWNFESIMQDILLVPNGQLDLQRQTINEEGRKRILDVLNMADISTVRVRHCPNSFGVSFKHKNNWKLTYSGDTMPCTQLITLGKYSDVLIHEATMEDELEEEARIKLHSTTSQAIEIGQKMLAKFIILTHFSQRYAKIPLINENFSSNVGIAFDNMQVYFHELPFLPLMHTALKIMFAEHYDEMEQKTYRRLKKQERENQAIEEK